MRLRIMRAWLKLNMNLLQIIQTLYKYSTIILFAAIMVYILQAAILSNSLTYKSSLIYTIALFIAFMKGN